MSNDTNQFCGRADELREYAFDELAPAQRAAIEKHVSVCEECALELDRLRLTTAALRVIPDREIPQRIAFVSESAPVAPSSGIGGWLAAFWNSGARLGFASACVLALAILTLAYRWPSEGHGATQVVQTAPVSVDVSKQVDEAVAKAMVQVRAEVRAEDARTLQAAIESNERKHEMERRALVVAMESMTVLQKRLNTVLFASTERPGDVQ